MKHKYGLSLLDYDSMMLRQNGLCGVCEKPPKNGRNLVVDHDHKSGKVRGLLCNYCNHYVVGRLTLAKAKAILRYLEAYG